MLLLVPITKPDIVMVKTAPIPIVQPRGPVPKASNAPPSPNAPPTTAFNTSQRSSLPDTRLAIPLVPSTIPAIVIVIPNVIPAPPVGKLFNTSNTEAMPLVIFQPNIPIPIATTTSFMWSKLSFIY